MTVSPTDQYSHAAALTSRQSPEVAVEQADDGGDDVVLLEGTAIHDGINRNAWGLTEQGAHAIADSLVGDDLTASHPPLKGDRYVRSMHGGQGAPIGEVIATEVVSADDAMLRDGGYTVKYTASILDPTAKQQFKAGLRTGDDYGVSVGIYGNPEDAVCSVCRDQMTACDHDRFQEVEVDVDGDGGGGGSQDAADGDQDQAQDQDQETVTQIAGPLYNDGESDHLASVFLPAYDGADAAVAADSTPGEQSTPGQHAARDALAAAFDPDPDDTTPEADAAERGADARDADADADADGDGVLVSVGSDVTIPVEAVEVSIPKRDGETTVRL
jgi:hypothetical protein